jgi:hypothetical protein
MLRYFSQPRRYDGRIDSPVGHGTMECKERMRNLFVGRGLIVMRVTAMVVGLGFSGLMGDQDQSESGNN